MGVILWHAKTSNTCFSLWFYHNKIVCPVIHACFNLCYICVSIIHIPWLALWNVYFQHLNPLNVYIPHLNHGMCTFHSLAIERIHSTVLAIECIHSTVIYIQCNIYIGIDWFEQYEQLCGEMLNILLGGWHQCLPQSYCIQMYSSKLPYTFYYKWSRPVLCCGQWVKWVNT